MTQPHPPTAFSPPDRLLLGPGPSNAAPAVLDAMQRPLVGHLDPAFIGMMEEIKSMLRHVFQTENEMTLPVSATGSAGMEACFVNLRERGDEVVIGVNGVFGTRMCDVAERCGATTRVRWTIRGPPASPARRGRPTCSAGPARRCRRRCRVT